MSPVDLPKASDISVSAASSMLTRFRTAGTSCTGTHLRPHHGTQMLSRTSWAWKTSTALWDISASTAQSPTVNRSRNLQASCPLAPVSERLYRRHVQARTGIAAGLVEASMYESTSEWLSWQPYFLSDYARQSSVACAINWREMGRSLMAMPVCTRDR